MTGLLVVPRHVEGRTHRLHVGEDPSVALEFVGEYVPDPQHILIEGNRRKVRKSGQEARSIEEHG